MIDPQFLSTTLLDLMAACGAKPIPMPLQYWLAQLKTVVGQITKPQLIEVLKNLEDAGLVTSKLDPLGVRRFWVTEAGVRVSTLTPRE